MCSILFQPFNSHRDLLTYFFQCCKDLNFTDFSLIYEISSPGHFLTCDSPGRAIHSKLTEKGKCPKFNKCTYQCQEAGGKGSRRIGRDFDLFQQNCCKIPYPRAKMWGQNNWNSPPRKMICGHGHKQKFKYPYPRDSKIIWMSYPGPKRSIKIPPSAAWHW